MSWILPALFFLVALIYSIAGFGGGSSYIALLILFEFPYEIIPIIGLACNLVVSLAGAINFTRAGHFQAKLLSPFLFASMPCAYLAGSMDVSKEIFVFLLASTLSYASFHLFFGNQKFADKDLIEPGVQKFWVIGVFSGAVIGFLSGVVGIGGGIFLSPLLYFLRWASPQQIASLASSFIFLNSLTGLIGQLSKRAPNDIAIYVDLLTDYALLPLVVAVAGLIGSFLGAKKLYGRSIQFATALLVCYVSVSLWWRWIEMIL
ncbi:MAG: sulfite exporter TauE/SafE family protein [Verrucomicrobiota bacterium]